MSKKSLPHFRDYLALRRTSECGGEVALELNLDIDRPAQSIFTTFQDFRIALPWHNRARNNFGLIHLSFLAVKSSSLWVKLIFDHLLSLTLHTERQPPIFLRCLLRLNRNTY